MRGKAGLAIAVLILPVLAVICLAFAVTLLGGVGESLPHAWTSLADLPGPGPQAARMIRHAIEGAVLVAACCAVVALVVGWTLGRLPAGWAAVASAMLFYPALTVVMAWLLGFFVLLPATDPAQAVVAAASALPLPLGPRVLLIVLLAPLLATSVGRAWRGVDGTALRAAETLGIGLARRFARLVLPELVRPLTDGAILVFLAAAAVLAVRPVSQAAPFDSHAIGAMAALVAAVVLLVALAWRGLSRRAVPNGRGMGRGGV